MTQKFYHARLTAPVTSADFGDGPEQVIFGYGGCGWLRAGESVYIMQRPAWTHEPSGRSYPVSYCVYHTQGYVVMPEAAAKKFLRCVRHNGLLQEDTTGHAAAIAARMNYHVSR